MDALGADRPIDGLFADYDVDGASSAAQLVRWFRHMGKELPIYVPDRMTEGYGPSPAAFRRLRAKGRSWWSPSIAARPPMTPSRPPARSASRSWSSTTT